MSIPEPLAPKALYQHCDPESFSFHTTAELEDLGEIIGQTRALEAIRFGIGMQHAGFNLFVLGPNGIGKHTAVHQFLEHRAASEPTPDDWCYVNNFDQPHRPRALRLTPGMAPVFAQDLKQLVEALRAVIPGAFDSDEYQAQKKAIEEETQQKQVRAIDDLKKQAAKVDIALIRTPSGFAFAPVKGDDIVSPDDFMKLPLDQQEKIENEVKALQESMQAIMQQLPHWQRETQKQIKELNEQVAIFAITPLFDELHRKYESLPHIVDHLRAVQSDVVQNVNSFVETERSPIAAMIGAEGDDSAVPKFTRYQVNVVVDHGAHQGAPVIHAEQPTFGNLIGRIEHLSRMGALVTDFSLIKPGVLHRANGGYLILDARELLMQAYSWEGLKHALRAHQIRIESLGQMTSLISTVSLDPEPIPLDIKVVLLGERQLYYMLHQLDPDFSELFKVAVDFDDQMDRNEASYAAYAQLISTLARKEALRHFDRNAVARVIEYSSRLVGDAQKLSTHMRSISDLLREASFWAGGSGHDIVSMSDVQAALDAQRYRASRIRERIQEEILRQTILIDTTGAVVGQINGLSVYSLAGFEFGRPSRITARFRLGKGEVIDIERQVEMGGPIHSKGVLILSSFLGARFAAERPLSLSASLVFEQSYGGVDGDSASSAELYALLSALANAAIKQSFAVTGSVNQHGHVQAIGGVNEKIEGFFELCQARGLTGNQGVLIPHANTKHLMLRQEVIDAVTAGQFHIYPIDHIDQGIEILTGIPAGKLEEDGTYPPDSINYLVAAQLEHLVEQQRAYAAPPQAKKEETA